MKSFHDIFHMKNEVDVLLIQPHIFKHTPVDYIDPVQLDYWESMGKVGKLLGDLPIEPNWGLLYMASSLIRNQYSVEMLDFHLFDYMKFTKTGEFIGYEDIEEVLKLKRFKVVGITGLTRTHHRALRIAQICKRINPSCKVVLGGIHFSFISERIIKECEFVDAVIRGEGEDAIVDLLKNLDNRDAWGSISGMVYRNAKGICKNEIRLKDINSIGYPAYDLWPSDIPLIPRIYLSRGCIGNCDYCVVNIFFKGKHRRRKIDDVIDEIIFLQERYNVSDLLIGDLCFPANEKDTLEFCSKIIEKGIKVQWWCQTRPEILNDEILAIMKRAGCVQIGIGIESANIDVLDKCNSVKTSMGEDNDIKKVCKRIKKHNIAVQGYFMIGLPGEDIGKTMKTIMLIDELTGKNLVDVTHISVLVPYPGTHVDAGEGAGEIQIIDPDYENYLMNCDLLNSGIPVYQTSSLSRYQIYSLWQLALSTAAKNFSKRDSKVLDMFRNLSHYAFKNDNYNQLPS